MWLLLFSASVAVIVLARLQYVSPERVGMVQGFLQGMGIAAGLFFYTGGWICRKKETALHFSRELANFRPTDPCGQIHLLAHSCHLDFESSRDRRSLSSLSVPIPHCPCRERHDSGLYLCCRAFRHLLSTPGRHLHSLLRRYCSPSRQRLGAGSEGSCFSQIYPAYCVGSASGEHRLRAGLF